ncbi:hypothetical protein NY546_13425 [Curtobacterium flaccumfaciens pv. flaccumfaciens]|uniref:hypothetical protein n=1 Tax=Curtobacterium flaccumfaciens TaxID=2035 RepID=UPI002657D226|nr:hypothetical protein [Curtobacterium flaccumfaciens]MCS5510298.1 hypothetical protein [Curtobacterium flaccumfaciens pv. flaccumfaciens]MCX2784961.1 hypothetical protein [Curtobacterium flaccumfaciens pv. flaccumfaciens]
MTASTAARPSRPVGHDPLRGGLRFLAELVAWVAVPWALWSHSPVLAIAAVLVLVVPPAVFGTPGDRPGGDPPVAAPGAVTIATVLAHLVGAVAAARILWPTAVAIVVTVLCVAVVVSEQPRWRALVGHGR